jgi:protein-S-isoprenylcysteine O-methyltransferase Ste14
MVVSAQMAPDPMMLDTDFQQAASTRKSEGDDKRPPFRFAPTAKIDFAFSLAYVILFIRAWNRADHPTAICIGAGLIGLLLALCYAGKVYIIGFLNQRGGDARTYVISSGLVTTGLYAYSRNPTYLLTFVQCLIWSALLILLQVGAPLAPVTLALSILLPAFFFLLTDRVIIEREDSALSAAHPEAFAAYSQSVRRWFGRKRLAGSGA